MSISIYTTYPTPKEAKKITNHLLKKKLIACANFFPVNSSYWWQGKITVSREVTAILKTTAKNWPRIKMEIKKMHSDKVPCIEKIEVDSDKTYSQWIKKVTI